METGTPSETTAFVPSCTVVIATRNRPQKLEECLKAVALLEYPRFDVMVVDNAPKDQQAQEVAARLGARYILEPIAGVNRSRNHGARSSNAEIIAFFDDDSKPEPGCLRSLVNEFRDARVMAVTGRILAPKVKPDAERLFELNGAFDAGPKRQTADLQTPFWFEVANFGGIGSEANMAVRRSAFDIWPGFNERIGHGTPLAGGGGPYAYFSLIESGYRVVYTPDAIVHHPSPQNREELRALYLKIHATGAAYMTLLFCEHGQYRSTILRYLAEWLRGVQREWRRGQTTQAQAIVVPRWLIFLACMNGPLLYARSLLAHGLSWNKFKAWHK